MRPWRTHALLTWPDYTRQNCRSGEDSLAFLTDYLLRRIRIGRVSGRKKGTLWYHHTLVAVFQKTGPSPPAAARARVVGEIERLARNAGKP